VERGGAGGMGGMEAGNAAGEGGAGPAPTSSCTPGQSVACVGPGNCQGGQVCEDDGRSYGLCDCGPADGGTQPEGADAGPTDTAGSEDGGGCGCAVVGSKSRSNGLIALFLLSILSIVSVRRRAFRGN
jgi:hypothetical protein